MFVVCPLIAASDFMPAKSVQESYEEIQKAFPARKVAMLHGKLGADDKQSIMQDFITKKTDILVSTTVIEVGVDVPNANIMLIESPERFGLAQIHQLRGRVGRGGGQGFCYLLLSDDAPPSRRLRAVEQSNDGFRLAELDLELRGPGAIYGSRQHGDLDLRLVSLTDTKLIKTARDAAVTYAKESQKLVQYPELLERVRKLQKINHLN
jgi:ATP-dependent DNA helicase RecG